MLSNDEIRQLQKIRDVLVRADDHFSHEAKMNAALHMAIEVRPAPLASAVSQAMLDLDRILADQEKRQS